MSFSRLLQVRIFFISHFFLLSSITFLYHQIVTNYYSKIVSHISHAMASTGFENVHALQGFWDNIRSGSGLAAGELGRDESVVIPPPPPSTVPSKPLPSSRRFEGPVSASVSASMSISSVIWCNSRISLERMSRDSAVASLSSSSVPRRYSL